MRISISEKVVFFVSAGFLLFAYGFGAATLGWPPGNRLRAVVRDAAEYFGSPSYVNTRLLHRSGARSTLPEAVSPGLTLVSSHWKRRGWRTGLRLVDSRGVAVHEWDVNPKRLFSNVPGRALDGGDIHGSWLFPNGDVLIVISYVGVARLDACGEVIWSDDNLAHHSISRADDGTYWVPTTTQLQRPRSSKFPNGYPGLNREMYHDHLLHLSESGERLDSLSVLDLLYGNDLLYTVFRPDADRVGDMMHVNDVEVLSSEMAEAYPNFEAGDLLVSLRLPSLVFVVDPGSGIVRWHYSGLMLHQHDPDFIGNGWIGIFDNREDGTEWGDLLGGSRILAVQPETDSVVVLYEATDSDTFYTPVLGKWQMLNNGNLLLTEGVTGRVLEVTSAGRTVWEWVQEPFDETHSVEVTEGTRYPLTAEEVAGWACGSARPAGQTGR